MGTYYESDTLSTPGTPSIPDTPVTPTSEDIRTKKVGGLIRSIGRKAAKRKAKGQVTYPVLDLVTKEMSTSGATNIKNSNIFERYVLAQGNKGYAAMKTIKLRDRHQSLKERE